MTHTPVTRRRTLRTVVAALPGALAGCFGHTSGAVQPASAVRLSMTAVTDVELPSKVLGVYADPEVDARARLFDRLFDEGKPVVARERPIPVGQHLRYGDTVYRVSEEVVERTSGRRYSVKIDPVGGNGRESGAVRISDLPAVDREVLAGLGLVDDPPIGIGTTVVYTDAEQERSVLVSGPNRTLLVYADGAHAEWVVTDADETTVTTARYTAERIASAAAYGRRMRDQFLFALADLSAGEREIVEAAITEGVYAVRHDETPSSATASLVDRFRGQQKVRALDEARADEGSRPAGPYLAEYENDVYWTRLTGRLTRGDEFWTETSA